MDDQYRCDFQCQTIDTHPNKCFSTINVAGISNDNSDSVNNQLLEFKDSDIGWTISHTTSLDICINELHNLSIPIDILSTIGKFIGSKYNGDKLFLPLYYCPRECYKDFQICHNWFNQFQEKNDIIHVTFMSDEDCGKSATILRYLEYPIVDSVLNQYDSTIEDEFRKKVTMLNNIDVTIDILDTGSYVGYESMKCDWRRSARMIVYMYDVRKELSFTSFEDWYRGLRRERNQLWEDDFGDEKNKLGIILCGNCCDSRYDKTRVVSSKQGFEMAAKYNIPFVEISAYVDFNVDRLFEMIVLEMWYTSCIINCPYT